MWLYVTQHLLGIVLSLIFPTLIIIAAVFAHKRRASWNRFWGAVGRFISLKLLCNLGGGLVVGGSIYLLITLAGGDPGMYGMLHPELIARAAKAAFLGKVLGIGAGTLVFVFYTVLDYLHPEPKAE